MHSTYWVINSFGWPLACVGLRLACRGWQPVKLFNALVTSKIASLLAFLPHIFCLFTACVAHYCHKLQTWTEENHHKDYRDCIHYDTEKNLFFEIEGYRVVLFVQPWGCLKDMFLSVKVNRNSWLSITAVAASRLLHFWQLIVFHKPLISLSVIDGQLSSVTPSISDAGKLPWEPDQMSLGYKITTTPTGALALILCYRGHVSVPCPLWASLQWGHNSSWSPDLISNMKQMRGPYRALQH